MCGRSSPLLNTYLMGGGRRAADGNIEHRTMVQKIFGFIGAGVHTLYIMIIFALVAFHVLHPCLEKSIRHKLIKCTRRGQKIKSHSGSQISSQTGHPSVDTKKKNQHAPAVVSVCRTNCSVIDQQVILTCTVIRPDLPRVNVYSLTVFLW